MAQAPINDRPATFEAYLLDQVQAAVIATDRAGRVTHWNRHAEMVYGWRAEEALGRDIRDLVLSGGTQLQGEEIMAAVIEGVGWSGEFDVAHRGGRKIPVHVTLSPMVGPDGRVTGLIGVSVDISERQRAEQRLVAQFAVTRVLAESMTVAETAPKILQAVCEGLDWRLGIMWRVDGEADVLRFVAAWHRGGERSSEVESLSRRTSFRRGVGLPGRIWAEGKPVQVGDVLAEPNFPRAPAATADLLHGALGAPILLGSNTLGVMEFFSREIRPPDDDLVRMMAVIGSQIGQFMERKEAEEGRRALLERERISRARAEQATGRLQMMQTITETALAHLDLDQLLREVLLRLRGGLFADTATVLLREEDGEHLVVRASDGVEGNLDEEGFRVRAGDGFAAVVAEGREPVLADGATAREILSSPLRERIGSLVAVPLRVEGRTIGVLHIGASAPQHFTQEDAGVLKLVADRMALAVDRARAYEEQRDARSVAEEAQARLAFLAEASRVLSSSLNYEKTLAKVARLAVPQLADWCTIHVVDDHGGIRRLAVVHSQPEKTHMAKTLLDRPTDEGVARGPANVIRSGEAELIPWINGETLNGAIKDSAYLEALKQLGLRSVMIVPLTARGRTLGAISLVSAESGRRYGEPDLALARDLAQRAALAIDNARLYQERSYIARRLQQSLLPPELPMIPGIEVAARYRPVGEGIDVGGDFYDVFAAGEGLWGVAVGDVCGKGADAAAVTGLARTTIRTAAHYERTPGAVLRRLNEAILERRADRFVTVAFALVETGSDPVRLSLACGGHPRPLALRADGTVEPVGGMGTLLGVFEDPEVEEKLVQLGRGESVVFYTDGVVEERGEAGIFGYERLVELIGSCGGLDAEGIADAIEGAVIGFRPERPRDDVAILVLRGTP